MSKKNISPITSLMNSFSSLDKENVILKVAMFGAWAALLAGFAFSPQTAFHPFWVLSMYFSAIMAIIMLASDINDNPSPQHAKFAMLGSVHVLAGVIIGVSALINPNVEMIWVVASLILWFFGAKNLGAAVTLWRGEAHQKQQITDREAVIAAQEASNILECQIRAEEDRKQEEALLADLTDFLADT